MHMTSEIPGVVDGTHYLKIKLPPASDPEKCRECGQWFRHTTTMIRHAVGGHHHCNECGDWETPVPSFRYRLKRWLKLVLMPEQF